MTTTTVRNPANGEVIDEVPNLEKPAHLESSNTGKPIFVSEI